MRISLVALILAGVPALAMAAPASPPAAPAAAPPAAAATPHAAPTPPPAPPNPDLSFYPAAARAAGVEGQATIRCGRDTHLKLEGCTLVSENPAGQGFGAAAMALAAANVDNPNVTTTESELVDPSNIVVRFTLHPPLIDPDVAQMAHMVTSPSIVTAPTHDQIEGAYPVRALSDQVDGGAVLDCLVSKEGGLTACRVLLERPDGYGFGEAALEVAKDYKLKPGRVDSQPVDGAEVRLPVPFTVADPDGPLELKTAPAGAPPPPQ